MVQKTEVKQIKEREDSPKYFYLPNDKVDLNGFQTNFEAFISQVTCHDLTSGNRRARQKGKRVYTFKKKRKTNNGKVNDCGDNFFSSDLSENVTESNCK